MSTILNIESMKDIEKIKNAILNHESFEIGEIKPLIYKIKLDGGRFKTYDINYITADIAQIIVNEQKNYIKFLNEIERNFDITFEESSKKLQFKLVSGSVEFIDENIMLEVVKQMESQHLMYVLLGLATLWFGHAIYSKYIEKELAKINAAKKDKVNDLQGQERENYLNTINTAFSTLKELSLNKPLQDSANNHTKQILSILKDDEKLVVPNIDEKTLMHDDLEKYEYREPEVEDIEEGPFQKEYEIDTYTFTKKLFKLSGVSTLANTDVLDPLKRIKLISKAEKQQTVTLEVKIIKDGVTKQIKSIYILDLIDS